MDFYQALGCVAFILAWIVPLGIVDIVTERRYDKKLDSGEWFISGNGN